MGDAQEYLRLRVSWGDAPSYVITALQAERSNISPDVLVRALSGCKPDIAQLGASPQEFVMV